MAVAVAGVNEEVMACRDLPFHRVVVNICLGASVVGSIALQSKSVMDIVVERTIRPVPSLGGVILPSSGVPRVVATIV